MWKSVFCAVAIIGFAVFECESAENVSITLAWDESPSPGVVAYRVYIGSAPGSYFRSVEVTNGVSATVSGLRPGVMYYFAATALDVTGLESEFSEEISYRPAAPSGASLSARMEPGSTFVISGSGAPGEAYRLETSSDLVEWSPLVTLVVSGSGLFSYRDETAPGVPMRFYRLIRVTQ